MTQDEAEPEGKTYRDLVALKYRRGSNGFYKVLRAVLRKESVPAHTAARLSINGFFGARQNTMAILKRRHFGQASKYQSEITLVAKSDFQADFRNGDFRFGQQLLRLLNAEVI